jgi:hypothetical protein
MLYLDTVEGMPTVNVSNRNCKTNNSPPISLLKQVSTVVHTDTAAFCSRCYTKWVSEVLMQRSGLRLFHLPSRFEGIALSLVWMLQTEGEIKFQGFFKIINLTYTKIYVTLWSLYLIQKLNIKIKYLTIWIPITYRSKNQVFLSQCVSDTYLQ